VEGRSGQQVSLLNDWSLVTNYLPYICCPMIVRQGVDIPSHGKPGLVGSAQNFRAWVSPTMRVGRTWAEDLGPMAGPNLGLRNVPNKEEARCLVFFLHRALLGPAWPEQI
jgi:hypothetical protein